MNLVDTGPLVALIDRHDGNHARCRAAAADLPDEPLLTTWPCFAEAMHLLHKAAGYSAQAALWKFYTDKQLFLHDQTAKEIDRMIYLMDKYKDAPMDLADASLIALAESKSMTKIFTLDSAFRFFRLANGIVLQVIP
ncbi:MAG TPA: PIN domain-containing protein [Gemmataceae bacterium]|nr:PIN domain-containing protein [Gemmataceae bacterium]